MKVVKLKLKLSNAYLLLGERPVLIDSGSEGDLPKIRETLAQHRVALADLAAVIHTHGHVDHAANSAEIAAEAAVPLFIHAIDADKVRRGENGRITPTSINGQMMKPFVIKPYPAFEPDGLLSDGQRLDELGIAGTVLHTPGHTAGSISVLLDNGEAIVGDLLMGGFMGGTFMPSRPRVHYFAEDLAAVRRSLEQVMAQKPRTLYVGHGGPLEAAAVAKMPKIKM